MRIESDLKTCPFCGDVPIMNRRLKSKGSDGKVYVIVSGEEAKSKWEWNTFSVHCKTCNITYPMAAGSSGEASGKWNRRHAD